MIKRTATEEREGRKVEGCFLPPVATSGTRGGTKAVEEECGDRRKERTKYGKAAALLQSRLLVRGAERKR